MSKSNESGGTIIYARISLDRDGTKLGVERQERECRELCESRGWDVSQILVDNDISATTGKVRPAFEELLEANPERIVVWHTDRLVRLTKDLERVITLGVNVHALHTGDLDLSNPAGRAVARTVTAWATYEGEQKALRQKAQHRQRRERGGQWWSTRPFGYNRDGSLHEGEAPLMEEGYTRMLTGTATWVGLCSLLNEAGATTTKGKMWTPTTTRQVFLSPRNAALTKVDGDLVRGGWEPIVDKETWSYALRLIGSPSMNGRGQGTRKGLLTGLVECGVCSATVQVKTRSTKQRGDRKLYGATCGHSTAPMAWLDDFVGKEIVKFLVSPAALLMFSYAAKDSGRRDELMRTAEALRRRLDDVADAFASGEVTRDQLRKASAGIRQQLGTVESDLQRVTVPTPLGEINGAADALAAWKRSKDLHLDQQRAIVVAVVDRIIIKRRKNGEKIRPDHVTIDFKRPGSRGDGLTRG